MYQKIVKRVSLLSLVLFIFLSAQPGYGQEKFNWSMSSSMPAILTPPKVFKEVLESVKMRTDGNLDVKLFTAGQLPYKNEDELPIVARRSVEMGEVNNQHAGGRYDWLGLTGQSIVFEDYNQALAMWSGPLMEWTNKKLKKDNVIAIAPIILSNQSVWAKKPLGSLKDLRNKRLRVPDSIGETLLAKLGALPVYMQFAEMNEAVMRGTIDGALTGSVMAFENPAWIKIYDYLLLLEVNYSLSYVCVNLDAWNELPAKYQWIMREEMMKGADKLNDMFFRYIEQTHGLVENPIEGLKVTVLSPQENLELRKSGKDLFDAWLNQPKRSAEAKELWSYIQELK